MSVVGPRRWQHKQKLNVVNMHAHNIYQNHYLYLEYTRVVKISFVIFSVTTFFLHIKILDLIHRRILWTWRKKPIWLVCVYIKTIHQFYSNHRTIKLIKKSKTKTCQTLTESTEKTYFVTHGFGLKIFIVEQSDSDVFL